MKKWTLEEDNKVREYFKKNLNVKGIQWSSITASLYVPLLFNRSSDAIKTRYYSHIKPQDDEANLINQSKQNINTMKTTFKPLVEPNPKRKYPYIGLNIKSNVVVIFVKNNNGTILKSDDHQAFPIGVSDFLWNEDNFKVIPNCTITFES